MASDVELKKIKKKYGEKFMHMCRDLFPTILEQEGALFAILENTFADNSRTLYEDIHENNLEIGFKNFIYSKVDIKAGAVELVEERTPYELLDEAGYDLYECETEEEIQEFKKYFAHGEELCTFDGGRLNICVVFFAVKKNVDEIKREDFPYPKREDEYGTSVMSIQFSKTGLCTVSIKNRYNHRVNNPDATYGNDLDRIIPGLSESFESLLLKRGLQFTRNNIAKLNIPNYVVAGDGKYYKYNLEIDGTYYCPGNVVIHRGRAINIGDSEKVLLVENFEIDLEAKTIRQSLFSDWAWQDSFEDDLQNIEKIEIVRDKESKDGERIITIKKRDSEIPVEIRIDRDNQIIGYKNLELEAVENNFLKHNTKLKYLELPMLTRAENSFLEYNKGLESLKLPQLRYLGDAALLDNNNLSELILPELREAGDEFLYANEKLKQLILSKLEQVGESFLKSNMILTDLYLPKLKRADGYFLYENRELEHLELPCLYEVGESFLYWNNKLKRLYLPKLEIVGGSFLYSNRCLKELYLPSLKLIGGFVLCNNEELSEIDLPSVISIGDYFIAENRNLEKVNMPQLESIGYNFLAGNYALEELTLPKLCEAGNGFLFKNKRLKSIYLPNLRKVGDRFLGSNRDLVAIVLPQLRIVEDNFLAANKKIRKVKMPLLERVGYGFMQCNEQLKELKLPSLSRAGNEFLAANMDLRRVELDNLMYVGENFLLNNEGLTYLYLPKLLYTKDGFISHNNNLDRLVVPCLKRIEKGFLGDRSAKITPKHLARLDKEKGLATYDIGEGKQIVLGLQATMAR